MVVASSRLPQGLHDEFPQIPVETIQQDVTTDAQAMIAQAHFTDFVPLLVHRAARQRLLGR